MDVLVDDGGMLVLDLNDIPNNLMREYIAKAIKEATVILCFKILLENIIENGFSATMSKPEIGGKFNELRTKFGISRFRTDYLLRQAGNDKNAIDQKSDRFFIKAEFLLGLKQDDIENLVEYIDIYWTQANAEQEEQLREISSHIDISNLNTKINFIKEMLVERETRKKGQCFEVTSFSILRVYLENLGFELNRFSTTYSNDGGIDFTAQTAVYQVTTKLTDTKFEEDLKKVPLKNRIVVFKEAVSSFDLKKLQHELITDFISIKELEFYLEYVVNKNPQKNLNNTLKTMLHEFQREYYQQ